MKLKKYLAGSDGKNLKIHKPNEYKILWYSLHYWRMHNEQEYRLQRYSIRHYDSTVGIVRLKFNKGQWKLWNVIKAQKMARKPVRVVMVKARQWGGSTLINAFITDETVFHDQVRSMFLAHARKTAQHLLRMSKVHFKHIPDELVIPKMEYDTLARKEFVNGSELTIESAKNLDAGAGESLTHLHLSEFDRFEHADILTESLEPTLPDVVGTSEFIESTAERILGEFHERYKIADDPKQDNGFVAVFVGWHEIERYTMRFEDDREKIGFEKSLVPEEKKIMEAFRCNLEQMKWYRWILKAKCGNNPFKRQKQYPSTADEAFMTIGAARFSIPVLCAWKESAQKKQELVPPKVYTVTQEGEFVPDEYGPFKVFEEPEDLRGIDERKVREYICAVDMSEGIVISEDGKKRDESAVQILKRGNQYIDDPKNYHELEQVAIWRGYLEPIALANIIYHIGLWYNMALVGIERGTGTSANDYLLHHRVITYPFMYHDFVMDKATKTRSKVVGFKTTGITRKTIIDTVAQMIDDDELLIHDVDTIEQCMTFKLNPRGKPEADKGCLDDTVLALAIGCQMNFHYRNFKQPADSIKKKDEFSLLIKHIENKTGKTKRDRDKKKKKLIEPTYTPVFIKTSGF